VHVAEPPKPPKNVMIQIKPATVKILRGNFLAVVTVDGVRTDDVLITPARERVLRQVLASTVDLPPDRLVDTVVLLTMYSSSSQSSWLPGGDLPRDTRPDRDSEGERSSDHDDKDDDDDPQEA
jgi:hypothetical protein